MLTRRHFVIAAAVAAAPLPAFAALQAPFDWAAFNAAQKAGKSILVDVSATWCPTCKAQRPILDTLYGQPPFHDLVVFEVDFDTAKDVLNKLRVSMQSTLIAFKGGAEVGRSVGDTNPSSIAALLAKSV